jgi:sec-independent protein translocase protein TatA
MGMGELLVVLVVVMIVFGANKLPGLGKGLGEAIRNFKDASSGAGEKPAERKELPRSGPPAGGPDAT